jgi:FkbM family methyltransferase
VSKLNYTVSNNNSNIPYTPIICKSITLDKLIEEYGTPDLIKIDVECGESSVLS